MSSSVRWPSTGKVFLISIVLGAAGVVATAAWNRHFEAVKAEAAAPAKHLAPSLDLAAQLPLAAVAPLRGRGYTTVIDLRPDGEAPDQPPSSEIAVAAKAAGLSFHYVPVPHGEIPEAAVVALRKALDASPPGPVLIYCRSGRRAARTWALVESQRPAGLTTDAIIAAVRQAGQEADDLRERLDAGVSGRASGKAGA